VKKTPNFSKFMVCSHGDGGLDPVRRTGRGSIFCKFVRTSFIEGSFRNQLYYWLGKLDPALMEDQHNFKWWWSYSTPSKGCRRGETPKRPNSRVKEVQISHDTSREGDYFSDRQSFVIWGWGDWPNHHILFI